MQTQECSVTLDEEDMATLRNQPQTSGSDEETVEESNNVTMNAVSTDVADSDEDDDAVDSTTVEPEPEPEPEPVKRKRVVKKKKSTDDD